MFETCFIEILLNYAHFFSFFFKIMTIQPHTSKVFKVLQLKFKHIWCGMTEFDSACLRVFFSAQNFNSSLKFLTLCYFDMKSKNMSITRYVTEIIVSVTIINIIGEIVCYCECFHLSLLFILVCFGV